MNRPDMPSQEEMRRLIDLQRKIKKDLRGVGWSALFGWLISNLLAIYAIAIYFTFDLLPQLQSRLIEAGETMDSLVTWLLGEFSQRIQTSQYANVLMIATVVFAIIGAVPYYVYGRRRSLSLKKSLGLNGLKAQDIARLFVMLLGVNMAAGLGVMLTEVLFNAFGFSIYLDLSMKDTTFSYWTMNLYAVLLAPLVEEYIYRGMLLEGMKKYGERFAVVASAVIFGLMHGNLMQFLPAVAAGLALGYIRIKTGSWSVCVILHALNNLFSLLIEALLTQLGTGAAASMADLLITIVFAAAGIALLVRFVKEKGELQEQKPQIRYFVLMSLPMMIYAYISLEMLVTNIVGLR